MKTRIWKSTNPQFVQAHTRQFRALRAQAQAAASQAATKFATKHGLQDVRPAAVEDTLIYHPYGFSLPINNKPIPGGTLFPGPQDRTRAIFTYNDPSTHAAVFRNTLAGLGLSTVLGFPHQDIDHPFTGLPVQVVKFNDFGAHGVYVITPEEHDASTATSLWAASTQDELRAAVTAWQAA